MNRLRRMGKQNSRKSETDAEEQVAVDGALHSDGVSDGADPARLPDTDTEMNADAIADLDASLADAEERTATEAEEPGAIGGAEALVDKTPDIIGEPSDGSELMDSGMVATDQGDQAADSAEASYENEPAEPRQQARADQIDQIDQEGLEGLDEGAAPDEMASMETDLPVERRRARAVEPQTAPLPQTPEPEALTPLPVGAVVDGRYIIQSQLHQSADRNLYRVTARQQEWCANCGRLSPSNESACGQCGSPLEGQPPAEFYLMAESYRPESLIRDPSLMQFNLYHPNLVPVIDFFEYKPFGLMRYFAVAEPRQGVRLSQLSMPRAGGQVLSWAVQLADALSYLHERSVVGAGAEADDILVQGDRASLASLQNAHVTTGDEDDLAQQQSIDLARLASTMFEAYTGQQSSLTPEGTLSMPPGAPEQVGAAFRAAIEPMQGNAPMIPVSQWRDLLARALEAVDELERPGRPVEFVAASVTNVGRVRDQNQDSYGTAEWVQASVEGPMHIGLYIVADGMGGHKGGEIASALAVQSVSGELAARIVAPLVMASGDRSVPTNEAILQGMTRAVQSANERIYKARDNRQNDMGTTLVAVLIAGGKAYVANVGDSRLYMYTAPHQAPQRSPLDSTRPLQVSTTGALPGTGPLPQPEQSEQSEQAQAEASETTDEQAVPTEELDDNSGNRDNSGDYSLSQVSVDHSLVHRLVELGQLDAEEAKVHPHRNFIYRSLGGPPPIEVDTFVRTLYPGDRLLLCSDGLNSMIEDDDIEQVLATEKDPHAACERLIERANEAGGHDNITTLLIDILDYMPSPEHPFALINA